jgi:hypothetical protein
MLTNFSPKHFEWLTAPQWEPYRLEISSFVPFVKKPDVGQMCLNIKSTLLRGLIIKKLAAAHKPFEHLLNMMNKYPVTALKVYVEIAKHLSE